MTATDAQFLRKIDTGLDGTGFENWDLAGLRLARSGPGRAVRIWSLAAPADAQPTVLLRGDVGRPWDPIFHPSGKLIATADQKGLAVWPLTRAYPLVIRKHGAQVRSVAFDPRGQWLVSGGVDENVRLWPLAGDSPEKGRILFDGSLFDITNLAVSPDSEQLLAGSVNGPAVVVPVDGSTATVFDEYLTTDGVAIGPGGKAALVASLPENGKRDLYVYDATSWQQPRKISLEVGGFSTTNPRFSGEHHIFAAGSDKVPVITELWRIDLQTENRDVLFQSRNGGWIREFAVSQDETRIALTELNSQSYGSTGPAVILDLEANTARTLESHGDQVLSIDLDLMGNTVVTGSADGIIRVGPTTGEEPHLLLGHEGRVWSVAIDPLGRWIASGSEDGTVRLWPMPDLSKPPLHTLPRDELIAKLKTLTNLRVVRDEESRHRLEAHPRSVPRLGDGAGVVTPQFNLCRASESR